jgi:phosphatidylglycerophosphate synthase
VSGTVTAGLVTAGLVGAGLVGAAVVTAQRPGVEPADRSAYFLRWQELHGGYDPHTGSAWLRGWLTMVHAIGRPLARFGVQPDVITVSSAWLGGGVVVLAVLGGRWWLAAGAVLVASGLLDNLDGCVAVLEGRVTRWGYVLDSLVDRVVDSLYLVAVVAVGCPVWLAVGAGFGCFLLEYTRARAGNAGGDEVGRITLAERPTRVIVLAAAILGAGIWPAQSRLLATTGTATLLALTAVAVVQLGAVVRRQLAAVPPTT